LPVLGGLVVMCRGCVSEEAVALPQGGGGGPVQEPCADRAQVAGEAAVVGVAGLEVVGDEVVRAACAVQRRDGEHVLEGVDPHLPRLGVADDLVVGGQQVGALDEGGGGRELVDEGLVPLGRGGVVGGVAGGGPLGGDLSGVGGHGVSLGGGGCARGWCGPGCPGPHRGVSGDGDVPVADHPAAVAVRLAPGGRS